MRRSLTAGFILLSLAAIIFMACPDNPDDTADCGEHQIKINGECQCVEGYYWDDSVNECLLDTTSHNFIWEIDTLGISGELYDAFILSPDNVWVVGAFDTDSGRYTIAQWNGNMWKYSITVNTAPVRGIWVFDNDDIWVTPGIPLHWDGIDWTIYHLYDMGILNAGEGPIYRLWGNNPNDIYFVGEGGSVVHYNGSSFEKMDSGTDIDLKSISGFVDSETDQVYLWTGGWEYTRRGQLLFFDSVEWHRIWDADNPYYDDSNYLDAGALWLSDEKNIILYVGGSVDGIIVHHSTDNFNDYSILDHNSMGAIHDIHGNNSNDYFLVGDFNNVLHYNGSSFRHYPELVLDDRYSAVAQYQDYVFICQTYLPVVIRGVRMP